MARNPPLKEKDQLFNRSGPESDFRFDADTATVFDDMVSRSVPFYDEIQRMTCEIAEDFCGPHKQSDSCKGGSDQDQHHR